MPDNYGTTDGFTAYQTARGRAAEIATYDADETAVALLVASEWIDAIYQSSFAGLKVGQRAQVREWPRYGAVDWYGYAIASDSNPVEVENATYEAALRQLMSPGSLVMDWTPSKYREVNVSGAVDVTYNLFTSASDAQTQFLIIDQVIAPILTGGLGGNASGLSGYTNRI